MGKPQVLVLGLLVVAAGWSVYSTITSRTDTKVTNPSRVVAPLAPPGWTAPAREVFSFEGDRVSGPYVFDNLTLYLVHGKDRRKGPGLLTLEEALRDGKVLVHETGIVERIEIENVSDDPVFVQSGDLIKGGKQDRVLPFDLVLGPGSGRVATRALCVERGRWSRRGAESPVVFTAAAAPVASRSLKLATLGTDQKAVWSRVARVQDQLSANLGDRVEHRRSRTSLALSLEDGDLEEQVQPYLEALSGILDRNPDSLGFVFAINGVINSADVYADRRLFRKQWSKLLRASAVEAVSERDKEPRCASPGPEVALAWLERCTEGRLVTRGTGAAPGQAHVESADSVFVESRGQDGEWLHRRAIRK